MRGFFVLTAAALLLTGCEEELVGPVPVTCDAVLTSYQPLTGDTLTTAEGVRYIDVAQGSGQTAILGGTVDVNYSLYTIGGQLLDTSCGTSDDALRFLIGGVQIVPGFQIGVIGMQEGGVRRAIVPSELAYPAGTRNPDGTPHALAGMDLIFDIQLIDQL